MMPVLNTKRNVIVSMIAFSANLVLVFISYRLVIAVGGLQALGLWSSLMAWIFVIRLGDVGMAAATVRFVAQCDLRFDGPQIRSYVDTALMLNIVLFAVLALLGYVLYIQNLHNMVSGTADTLAIARDILPLLFAGFFLSNISGLILGGLTGLHRGYQAALLGMAGTVVQLAVVVWSVPQFGLAGLAWGLISQHAILIILGWGLFLIAMQKGAGDSGALLPLQFSLPTLKEMLSFSLKTQFANLLNGLFEPLSKIFIERSAGLEVLGLFELAFKVVALPRNVIVSGVQATVPSLTRLLVADRNAARTLFVLSENKLMRGSVALTALVILVLPAVSSFVLQRLDTTLWIFTALLGLGFLGNSVGATAYVLCIASGRAMLLILSSALTLALLVIFVPLTSMAFGVIGAVSGVALALASGGLLVKRLSRKIWD